MSRQKAIPGVPDFCWSSRSVRTYRVEAFGLERHKALQLSSNQTATGAAGCDPAQRSQRFMLTGWKLSPPSPGALCVRPCPLGGGRARRLRYRKAFRYRGDRWEGASLPLSQVIHASWGLVDHNKARTPLSCLTGILRWASLLTYREMSPPTCLTRMGNSSNPGVIVSSTISGPMKRGCDLSETKISEHCCHLLSSVSYFGPS